MSGEKREEVETRQVFESYAQAWSSRVMNALLTEFEVGNATMPKGFHMKGINLIEHEDGSFIIGFVISKEAN